MPTHQVARATTPPASTSQSKRKRPTIEKTVFFVSTGLLCAFIAFGVFAAGTAKAVLPRVLHVVGHHFGWFYVVAVNGFLAFCVWLLISPYRTIRLGKDADRPEFPTLTWLAMLFSAGMGIGLVFNGVAEPIHHYAEPPVGEGRSFAAAQAALPITYLHWGVHAWSIYAVVALTIGFFSFRHDLPLTLRAFLYPLIGNRLHGWPGHVVDILAVISTLFGLAVSLGLGAMQVTAGLEYLFDLPDSLRNQLLVVAVVTLGAMLSLLTGMKKGIRRLSELNIVLATVLVSAVFVLGPSRDILTLGVQSVGPYVGDLIPRSFFLGALDERATTWTVDWTVTYWAWWIAWAPFVGSFVARVSRGRTFREFILGSLLVPTGMNFVWFSVFGGSALRLETTTDAAIADAVTTSLPTAIYALLSQLPLAPVLSFITVCVVSVFFITSSDSASLVVDMLTSGGHPNPPAWQRVFWATAEGATAAVLLYAGAHGTDPLGPARPGEALKALQAGVITMGLPFCLILVAMAYALTLGVRREFAGRPLAPGAAHNKRRREQRSPPVLPLKLERILVPIDYSEQGYKAVEHALGLAELSDPPGQVDVLHVSPEPAEYLPLERLIREEKRTLEEVLETTTQRAQSRLQSYLEERPGIVERVRARVENGIAWRRIVDVAERDNYDLIVLGSETTEDADDAPLSDVAQRVIGSTSCPAVIV